MTANQETSLREALHNAIALFGGQCTDATQRVWLESAREALAARAEPQAGEVALLEEYGRGYDAGFEIGDRLANADLDAMVDRFLAWKLPSDFHPDAGITFAPNPAFQSPGNPNWPVGTNLLTAAQARAMFEHCAAHSPASRARPEAQGEALLTNPHTGTPRDWRDVEVDPEGKCIVKAGEPLRAAPGSPHAWDATSERCVNCPPADRAPGEVGDERKHVICVCPDCLAARAPAQGEAIGEVYMPVLRQKDGSTEVGDERVTFTEAFTEHLASIAPARVALYTSAPAAGDGEPSFMRVVAKRNLRSLIERSAHPEKELMLKCLEELS